MSSAILSSFFLMVVVYVIQLHCEVYPNRPKIKTSDGDLILEAAYDKNIYLRPNGLGSTIFVGNIDVLKTNTAVDATPYQLSTNIDGCLQGSNRILQRLELIENKVQSSIISCSVSTAQNISLWRKVNSLNRKVIALENVINNRPKDKCDSHPCQHGGTCLNLVDGYHCLCPPTWEGVDCDMDVNECRNFAGTDIGCQNGATCVNSPGTYECLCRSDWYGVHCTRKAKDCSGGDFEMCGYGTCIPVTSGEGIKCICHQGWTSNATSYTCLTDVNECESFIGPRCSVSPRVECINLPGSFRCGQCPSGYEGDGYTCYDIDECIIISNGGCSPMVTCHNTIGSRICGSCPTGYQGDGVTCTYIGSCNINHGGCHLSAKCLEELSPTGLIVQCICPDGMTGDGRGFAGCYVSTSNYSEGCAANPCGDQGRCHSLSFGYTCICNKGYSGAHCDTQVDNCTVNPCYNGGVCKEDINTGFRCECTALYSGKLCQVRLESCGGILENEEGNITYPLFNANFTDDHDSHCVWQISTDTDKVINVTFSKFNLETTPECTNEYLQIHDGRKLFSQLIGRFCGDTLPKGGTIVSSHNSLYLMFYSDRTTAITKFVLHWTSVKPLCGGEIDATTHGRISSPGSPGPYPPNRDCYWHLMTTVGMRINVRFFSLDIEPHANCIFDYLTIYDGRFMTDPLLSKFCNSTLPPAVQSASSNLLIHFHSDSNGSGNGFQIVFESVIGIPGCGGFYTEDHGEIVSPTDRGQYWHSLICEYKIRTSSKTKIKIEIKLLDVPYGCEYNYLKIYDGQSADSPIIATFCVHDHPATFTSSSNILYLIYRFDLGSLKKGFRIIYDTVCEETLLNNNGIIKSPIYEMKDSDNQICSYVIKTDFGKAIQLTFQDFIEDPRHFCWHNTVEIKDGPDINSTLLGSYSGGKGQIPPVQISTHNYMYLRFKSELAIPRTCFYANYTFIDTECGGLYRNTTGIINYPSEDATTLNNDHTCIWLIVAPQGTHIKVTWNRFEFENVSNCNSNYLELIEVNDYDENDVIGKYCGMPPAFTTFTNRLKIKFVPDKIIRNAVFSLSYAFLDDVAHCGGNYLKTQGTIHSPKRNYYHGNNCTWLITVPVGQQISLNIIELDLKEVVRNQCKYYAYLEIRNGASQTSPLIGQFCGSLQSKHFTSLSNVLYLHFYSNPFDTSKGFTITWDSTITGCGGILTSSNGSIFSPNYPNDYHENAECFYKIVISAGSRIGISFTELDLERTSSCDKDYIEIYDGCDMNAPSLGKHCEMSAQAANIEMTTNIAFIKFRSDSYIGAKGFILNYYTICNNTLTGRYGVIQSPGYPSDYPSKIKCVWNIQVAQGHKIKIIFTHFDVANTPWELFWKYRPTTSTCSYDYLQVKDISEPNLAHKFCGSSLPNEITTKGNLVEILFSTVSYTPYSGFRLEWANLGCGGHIKKLSGILSFDKSLSTEQTIECEWLIETSKGKSINIMFDDIFMTGSQDCNTDAIEIYNGQNIEAPLLSKICHDKHVSIKSDSNFMIVRFIKLSTLKDAHFSAHFNSSDIKCGGSMSSMSGYIYSKNYPNNYDNNQDCFWYISVPTQHRIEINFIDIDLYYSQHSIFCNDSILIYDTNNYTPSMIHNYRICRNSNDTRIITEHNNVVIQFKTDSNGTARGFKANYSVTCGTLIFAAKDGVISNNKYINHSNKDCVWTIIAHSIDQKISVTITHIALPKNTDVMTNRTCPSTFLRIFDGIGKNSPPIDEFCGRKIPPMIVSQGNEITIELGSYTDKISGDFSVHYSPIFNACGGALTGEEGSIASPLYPRAYPVDVDCEWMLKTSPGNTIYVTFEKFELEFSEGCNEDYLELREDNREGKLLGLYCGTDIPTNHTKAANIYIKFHSNSRTSGKGFLIHFGYLHENVIFGNNGEITSPLYPTRYEGSAEYSWRIVISSTKKITLSIDQLEIPSYGDLSYNKLIIYDGYNNAYPILKEFYGTLRETKTFQTSSNVVYIVLIVDISNIGSIFHLTWRISSVSDEFRDINCGSYLTELILPGQIGILKTPNYPKKYGSNLLCEWTYSSQTGRHLSIRFETFQILETYGCYTDSLSIYSADILDKWNSVRTSICTSTEISGQINSSKYIKIKFKTRPSYKLKDIGFKAAVKSACGGVIVESSGEFGPTWSDVNSTLPKNQSFNCNWTAKVKPGRSIQLNFIYFNISNDNEDCKTFVLLRNGDSIEGPLLASGKYCGKEHEKKADIVTTGNSLFVSYTTRVDFGTPHIYQTFKIYFEEKTNECGLTSKLSPDHRWEVINTPNYPSVPIPYSECVWVFTGPPGVILRIEFVDRFDIDDVADNCQTEVVEIRDGSTDLSPVIGRYCGPKPGTIKSTSDSIFLKYSTQLLEPRNGFKANISIDICGGTIIAESGEVKSPGYPLMHSFPHDTECEWHVIGKPEHTFYIQLLDINLPHSQSKCGIKIEIKEIVPLSTNSTLLNTICNDDIETYTSMRSIKSSNNQLMIKFSFGKLRQSDHLSDYRGFRISFNSSQVVCSDRITSSEGYITTPDYPRETIVTGCHWVIEIPNKSRRVRLEIIDSNQEKHEIKIFNHLFSNDIQIKPNIMASTENNIYESVANKLEIYIQLIPSARSHRFQAKFTSNEEALCGGDLSSIDNTLISPDLQRSYICEWHYNNQAAANRQNHFIYRSIYITVNLNSSGAETSCQVRDPFITFTSPVTNRGKKYFRKICDNTNETFRVPSSVLDISAIKRDNEILNFSLNLKSQPCGGIVHVSQNPVNIISTPDSYNETLDCAWILNVPNKNRVEFNLVGTFLLECDDEYVQIMANLEQNIPLRRYCKDNFMEKPLITSYEHMYIQYHSNVKMNNSHIKLMVKSANNQCGGLITSYENIFSTPNYPLSYFANAECVWEIEAELGFKVYLEFIGRFAIEDTPNCTKDAIIIYDWKDDVYEEIARECGRQTPPSYISTSNRLKVILRTDAETNLDGFKAQWSPMCEAVLRVTEEEQILSSPGYPYKYKPNMVCSYELIGPHRKKILLKFLEFDLEGFFPECMSDNLTIRGLKEYHFHTEVVCGDKIPVTRTYDFVTLKFKTDSSVEKKGFKVAYRIYECGGKINETTVIASSLGYDTYDSNSNCTWWIEAPPTKIIVVKLLYIDLNSEPDCAGDSVTLYDGLNIDTDKRLALLCGHINSTKALRSTGPGMVLQFISDYEFHYTLKGFKAAVYFSYSEAVGCGGRISLTDASLHVLKSPLIGKTVYENYLDCHWSITSPPGTVIKITFNKFHIAPCQYIIQSLNGYSKCNCDSVEIYDGLSPDSLEIGSYCGDTLPVQLTTSSNVMSVRLSTDGEVVSTGFEATLSVHQTICGESIIAVNDTPRRLLSPGYDEGSVPRGLHCVYHLVNDDPESGPLQRIRISIINLQLRLSVNNDENRCFADKLIISSTASHSNRTAGNHFVMNYQRDDYFNRLFAFETNLYPPKRIEFCGQKHAVVLYMSGSTSINIITSPDSDNKVYRGVEIEVAKVGLCGRNYTELQGRIVSGFQTGTNWYEPRQDCYKLITAPENYTISVYFLRVSIDPWYRSTYLEIFDGNNTSARQLAKIYSTSDHNPIFSTGRYMLMFHHQHMTDHDSYDLNYVTTNKGIGCGGRLNNLVGAVSSPLYPASYRHNRICEWVLETPEGTQLLIRFNVFDLGLVNDQNYLQLVDRKGVVVRTFSSEFPADYTSNDNYLRLVYHTTLDNTGRGWYAVFAGTQI